MQEEQKKALQITKYGSQILTSDPYMDEEMASKIVSSSVEIFKQQQRLFDVNTHRKAALETKVQQYKI